VWGCTLPVQLHVWYGAATVNRLAALGRRSRVSSEAQSEHSGEQTVRRLPAFQLRGADFLTSFVLASAEFRSGSIELFEL